MNVFRMFEPKKHKQDTVEKRRHQLRQAQRTYRDRSVKYTKSLEQELARVRASEAKLMMGCEQMCGIIQTLTNLLVDCGADIPVEITNRTHAMLGQNPLVAMGSADTPLDDRVLKLPSSTLKTHSVSTNSNQKHVNVRVCDLDPTAVGMEFVLSLEEPCLGHLHGDPQKPDDPAGHTLTMSAHIECVSNQTRDRDTHPVALQLDDVPATILQNLLSLSSSMCLENELTPTQAWHQIRQQSYFGGLEPKHLRKLATQLRETIKCHGYGAVIQAQTFKALMYETLILGRAI